MFYKLVTKHGPKLYAPGDFADDQTYLAAHQREVEASVRANDTPIAQSGTPALALPVAKPIEAEEAIVENDAFSPKPDWTQAHFRIALYNAFASSNLEKVEKLSQDNLESLNDPLDTAQWKALVEMLRIRFAKGGSIATLKFFAAEHPQDSKLAELLADGFFHYQNYQQAGENYRASADMANSDAQAIYKLGRAALSFALASLQVGVEEVLAKVRSLATKGEEAELGALRAIRETAAVSKEALVEIAAMERMIELEPSDVRTRFQLAYKYAEEQYNDMALKEYLEIPVLERDSSSWNNIGVEYERFSISSKAINAFRQSEAMGETLAVSNIAQRLLAAGFLKEAQEKCESVISEPNCHPNVSRTLASIQNVPGEEDQKEEELLRKVRSKSDFFRLFGRAIVRPEPIRLEGQWTAPECLIHITVRGQELFAKGLYEEPANLLAPFSFGGTLPPRQKNLVIEAQLRGMAAWGSIKRVDAGSHPASLLSIKPETEILMVISDDERHICVMEKVSSGGPSTLSSGFYRFYRIVRGDEQLAIEGSRE